MSFIKDVDINSIRKQADIIDIISSYIPLTQKGKNYFGICPFHEDHSPSMSVSQDKQIYKCFSCGASGNVFSFIENYLNVSFGEAVKIVASKIGIAVEGDFSKKEKKYQKEYDLMNFTLKYYQNNLNSLQGEKAVLYLDERGLKESARNTFDIGLSLDDNMLNSLLINKGYSKKMLEDLGLISTHNGKIYDTFQNRIIFPIHNLDGDVVGYTARCYLTELKPKYLNTKETYIFRKGDILFNYHRAKDEVRLKKELIIVEGNMDAIRMYINGFKNTIALMGTNLTKFQIDFIKKLRVKVILMLDNDEAGENATYSVGNLLEDSGIKVEVVRLSKVKDPDEYLLSFGEDTMKENIKNAVSFMDFKLNYLKKNKNLDSSTDLADYIKSVLANLRTTNDNILTEVTLQKLANEYNISYVVLKEQFDDLKSTKEINKISDVSTEKVKKTSYDKVQEEILYCMMNDINCIKIYQSDLGLFPEKKYRQIANEIIYYYNTNDAINLADFITYTETTNLKNEIMDIISNAKITDFSEEIMKELINNLNKQIKKQEIKKLKEELRNEFDINRKISLTEKIAELKKEV